MTSCLISLRNTHEIVRVSLEQWCGTPNCSDKFSIFCLILKQQKVIFEAEKSTSTWFPKIFVQIFHRKDSALLGKMHLKMDWKEPVGLLCFRVYLDCLVEAKLLYGLFHIKWIVTKNWFSLILYFLSFHPFIHYLKQSL